MAAVAVLGLGHMGASMARRLLATGHQVSVWNRTARPVDAGAAVATSPAEAVREADVVFTMLADAAAVDAVLFGPDGAAEALRPGSVVVQTSTIGLDDVRALASRLPTGVSLVDAPVAGSVGAAEAGQLILLVGGDDETLDRVTPVLTALGTVQRCGALGAGTALKLVLNTALITSLAALADVLAVAAAVGVDETVALDALADGALGGAVARARRTDAAFSIALAGKDVDLARHELGDRPAPVVHATADALRARPDQTADIATLVLRAVSP